MPLWALWGLMVLFILIGQVWSLLTAHRIAAGIYPTRAAALRSELPMLVCMVLYSALSLWIIAQPMEMRTSL